MVIELNLSREEIVAFKRLLDKAMECYVNCPEDFENDEEQVEMALAEKLLEIL